MGVRRLGRATSGVALPSSAPAGMRSAARCGAATTASDPFPLAVSANGRYLQTPGSTPLLVNIAAGSWDLVQAVSYADFTGFVDTQRARGFNALHISAISFDGLRYPTTTGNHFAAPNWNNGSSVPPFTTPGNFSTLNATYVTHLLACLDYCASVGILVILQISYVGAFGDNNEGWGDEMVADTDAHLFSYGAALATAIAGRKNIIMGMGGDKRPDVGSTLESRLKNAVDGFRSVDTSRLWVGHWGGDPFADGTYGVLGGDLAYDNPTFASGYDLLWSHYAYNQAGKRARRRIRDGYGHSPTRPTLVLDASYENDPVTATALELRARTHATMCEGSCSLAYARGGNSPDGWTFLVSLGAVQGTTEHGYAWQFWNALPWHAMAPDAGVFVTSGRGTDGDTVDTYVSVLAATTCLVAYFPSGSSRTITLDMSQFTGAGAVSGSGVRRARWRDPTAGTDTLISNSLSTSGTRTFGSSGTHGFPAGSNSAGNSDWLLVVD